MLIHNGKYSKNIYIISLEIFSLMLKHILAGASLGNNLTSGIINSILGIVVRYEYF